MYGGMEGSFSRKRRERCDAASSVCGEDHRIEWLETGDQSVVVTGLTPG